MKYLPLVFLLLISCQSTPEPVPEKKPVEEVFEPVVVTKPLPPPKKVVIKPIVPPKPTRPDTISKCPSGVAGMAMSSFTNNGRYCYSRPKEKGCHKNTDEVVINKAKRHCIEVDRKRKAMGVSSGEPVEVSHIKPDSCSCGWNKGVEVCKSYLKVICREVAR